ncbi:MAG: hypothetical protein AAFP08_14600, partial [Bacteroidota bacterium]
MGYLYSLKNVVRKGLSLNKIAYDIAQEVDDPELLSFVANSVGRSYSFLGLFDSSNVFLQEAITLQREKLGNNPRTIFELKVNIGNNYGRAGQSDLALTEFEGGLELMQA